MRAPRLIFLKSPSPSASEDKYTRYVTSQGGHEPVYIPPLTSRLVSSAVTSLRACLSSYDSFSASYSGLVLTSQRSVEALAAALPSFSSSASTSGTLEPCPLFVVGPATGSAASACCEAQGFPVHVVGMESGNAAALAVYILEHFALDTTNTTTTTITGTSSPPSDKTRKPLLYLAGETHDPGFAATLRRGDVPVEEVVVYATAERAAFGAELRAASRSYDDEELWLVACAPSGLAATLKALDWVVGVEAAEEDDEDNGGDDNKLSYDSRKRTKHIKVAAIGPKTEQTARERFAFPVDATAESPTPEGVWKAVMGARG